jgi:hypothetical protein
MRRHIKKLIKNWDDSVWWKKVAFPYVAQIVHKYLSHQGIKISDEDWDNMIILDACRYDMFATQSELTGELSKRASVASNTPEFLQSNFKCRDFSDTVYVTANPQVNVHLENEFFKIINVWEDNWDDDLHTVMPDVMTKETVATYNAYPNKRLIAHFVQPHYPFIGEAGQHKLNTHSGMELSRRLASNNVEQRDQLSIWEQLYNGSASSDLVLKAYKENLDIVLPYVAELIETFQEYTVVTSDHGNALGERAWPIPVKIYGHPPRVRMPALNNVPWLVTNTDRRKEIIPEESSIANTENEMTISKRLSYLGYK